MKTMTIAEFKRHLPSLLDQIAKGESVILQKGRKRENVAILSPFRETSGKTRELGLLSERGKPIFKDWGMNEDDFLASR